MKIIQGHDLPCLQHMDGIHIIYFDGKFVKGYNEKRARFERFSQLERFEAVHTSASDVRAMRHTFYHCCIDDDVDATEFVVEKCEVHSVPVIITLGYGVKTVNPVFQSGFTNEDIDNDLQLVNETMMISALNRDKNLVIDDAIHLLGSERERGVRLFVSGDRSSVGKSTSCLSILSLLLNMGIKAEHLAYIKPVTQCEMEQPVTRFCKANGITTAPGPVTFYKGFTRAYLAGETSSSENLIEEAVESVNIIAKGKLFTLIDGVGYPAVGSICNLSNGHVAQALNVPVLLIGKSGVGDAVDSHNLNSTYFESFGVNIIGSIFNKLSLEGYYNVNSCKEAVSKYFYLYKKQQTPYGFVPKIDISDIDKAEEDHLQAIADKLSNTWKKYVNIRELLQDARISSFENKIYYNKIRNDRKQIQQQRQVMEMETDAVVLNKRKLPSQFTVSGIAKSISRGIHAGLEIDEGTHILHKRPKLLSRADIEQSASAQGAVGG
jgi:dethiobiotin synthetase